MRSLGDAEIDFIREDIRRRGVFTESLQEDLLDHLCCFIEEQPDDGQPFGEVYRRALESFGQNGLQEVQDETLLLINQKHQTTMKKLTYISGAIASFAVIFGALFKVQHWPGANVLLILGTLLLIFLFFPSFFYMQFKEQTEKRGRFIAASGLATAIMLCLGALFKIMHWPGAMLMINGFILFFVVFLPLYVINGIRNPLTRLSSISNGFLFATIGGFMLLLSFQNPGKNVVDSFTIIHDNEKMLLGQLRTQLATDSSTAASATALDAFVKSCDNAVSAIPQNDPEAHIGNGAGVEHEALDDFNTRLATAVKTLNTTLEGKHWKPLVVQPFGPAQLGSIRFQVLQLECRAYTQALGN